MQASSIVGCESSSAFMTLMPHSPSPHSLESLHPAGTQRGTSPVNSAPTQARPGPQSLSTSQLPTQPQNDEQPKSCTHRASPSGDPPLQSASVMQWSESHPQEELGGVCTSGIATTSSRWMNPSLQRTKPVGMPVAGLVNGSGLSQAALPPTSPPPSTVHPRRVTLAIHKPATHALIHIP